MAKTVADFLLERLQQWHVERIFGYPGGEPSTVFVTLRSA